MVEYTSTGKERPGRRLRGQDNSGTLFEWYGESGGQLKYYPLATSTLWESDVFQLEPMPKEDTAQYGVLAKARAYFPERWAAIST